MCKGELGTTVRAVVMPKFSTGHFRRSSIATASSARPTSIEFNDDPRHLD
jgi:hypothetical protein